MAEPVVTLAAAAEPERERYLLRMESGPAAGDVVVSSFDWAWPLPAWLEVPDGGAVDRKRSVGRYVKVSESQITDEQMASMTHVMRGAQYVWEPVEVDVGPPPSTIQKGPNQ